MSGNPPENRAGHIQLPMFLSAKEIVGEWNPLEADRKNVKDGEVVRKETNDELYGRKLKESDDIWRYHSPEGKTLRGDIKDRGVRRAIHLQTPGTKDPVVLGGHHRLAAMLADNPHSLMPVLFSRDSYAAKSEDSGYEYT